MTWDMIHSSNYSRTLFRTLGQVGPAFLGDISGIANCIGFRSNNLADVIGTHVSKLSDGAAVVTDSDAYGDWSTYNYRTNLRSPDGPEFRSWPELYGPHQINGDDFSSIFFENFDNATSSSLPW